jgi:hypothetical protein
VYDPEHIATAKRMKADGHTGKDIAKYLGVSRATLYGYLTEHDAAGSIAGSGHALGGLYKLVQDSVLVSHRRFDRRGKPAVAD